MRLGFRLGAAFLADPRAAIRRPIAPVLAVTVPICTGCARQWKRRQWRAGLITSATMVAGGLAALWAARADSDTFWVLTGGLCLLAPLVGAAVASGIGSPVKMKILDVSRGLVRLRFRNHKFPSYVRSAGESKC